MLVEAKALAQMKAAEAIIISDFNTLHTDGTKVVLEFGGVQFSEGINRGQSEKFKAIIMLINPVLTDTSKKIVKNSDTSCKESLSNFMLWIKNMMSDCCIVNQSLKTLLGNLKKEVVPWNDDTDSDLIKNN